MTDKPLLEILDADGNPVAEPDVVKWAEWFQSADRCVAQEQVGDALISTIFLGVNHNFTDGPPIVWETMIFGGKLDQEQVRCSGSRKDAEAMHARMVQKVNAL